MLGLNVNFIGGDVTPMTLNLSVAESIILPFRKKVASIVQVLTSATVSLAAVSRQS